MTPDVDNLMEKVVSLAKRRGFIFPDSEIYGGMANTWDYGPLGIELKRNIKNLWWKRFVHERSDVVGLESALLMNPRVWEASGHLEEFSDPLVECRKCHARFRADDSDVLSVSMCPSCKERKDFTSPKQFNLMFKTHVGPVDDESGAAYFRPETAQGMFAAFKNVVDSTRVRIPFGIAQTGKAFRNEITTGNFIFRTREFEQMEIEYFIREGDWEKYFEYWREDIWVWMRDVGIDEDRVAEADIPDGERAHYSKRTIDFEFVFPFGKKELYGLAYRTDYDLKRHMEVSGVDLRYTDPDSGEKFIPHVIEPTWGVERTVLAILLSAYHEEGERKILKLKSYLAPYQVAVFPLLANKPALVELAKKVYDDLRKQFVVAWDDRGNVGKRYYAQDEIGTPYCITVDFDSLEKGDVTVRDRDTAKQERVKIEDLSAHLSNAIYQKS